jgi:hypothetical protein
VALKHGRNALNTDTVKVDKHLKPTYPPYRKSQIPISTSLRAEREKKRCNEMLTSAHLEEINE